MVDVSLKDITVRKALAVCQLTFQQESGAYKRLIDRKLKKGDAFEMAKVAGIMAAKQTNSKFMAPMKISAELAEVVGKGPMPRTEVTKLLWDN